MMTIQPAMQLIQDADALLTRSAQTFTRAAVAARETPADGATPPPDVDLPGAVTDILNARLLHSAGTLLLRVGREMDRHLLDVFA